MFFIFASGCVPYYFVWDLKVCWQANYLFTGVFIYLIMKKIYLLLVCVSASLLCLSQEGLRGVTVDFPRIPAANVVDFTGRTTPSSAVSPVHSVGYPSVISGKILDSLSITNVIPAGSSYSMRYNFSIHSLDAIAPDYNVTSHALAAIGVSPAWLEHDLFDIFRRLPVHLQDTFAHAIQSAPKKYRDEVAFQVAHLSPRILEELDPSLPLVNAKGVYAIEPDLQFVELVEYECPLLGWYTTTRYRIVDSIGDTVWVEIPKEIYYQWVLMPRLNAEQPKMDHTVHNEFWRTYIYNNADPGYPLLREKLKNTKVLWDGRAHRWRNKDSLNQPVPFYDSLPAVAVVGRWVAHTLPERAFDDRPTQPNIILHEHNGNCGELQDLLNSGSRTALYPVYSLGSWPGDHVWCEIYCPMKQKWAYYQVSWANGPTDIRWDKTYPDKACIAGWRSDGYRWMLNHHYNPVFTLIVRVVDQNEAPIDGAEVFFFGAQEDNPQGSDYILGSWGHTNENGELIVQLGTNINYGFRADWEHGGSPSSPTSIFSISHHHVSEGDTMYREVQLPGTMPQINLSPYDNPTSGDYSIHLRIKQKYQTLYGGGYWPRNFSLDDCQYAEKIKRPGNLYFFMTNVANFNLYQSDTAFQAYNYKEQTSAYENVFRFPAEGNFYLTLSNEQMFSISRLPEITAYLVDNTTSSHLTMEVYPNPFSSKVVIQAGFAGKTENYLVNIYDIHGRLIKRIEVNQDASGKSTLYWDGRNQDGYRVSSGMYLVELQSENSRISQKVIFMKDQQ